MSKQTDAQSRWLIEQEIFKLRYLQKGCEMPDSELFQVISKVFKQTGDIKESEMTLSLAVKFKARERASKLTD